MMYNIYSRRTQDYVTFNLKELLVYFDREVRELIINEKSFEISEKRLSKVCSELATVLANFVNERTHNSTIPPNNEMRIILGKKMVLNLRDQVDEKIFWHGAIHRLMEDATKYHYPLKFFPNRGTSYVDNSGEVEFRIL